jgi:TolB protein
MSMINNLWSVPVSTGSGETAGPPRPLTRDTSYRKSNPFFSPSGSKIAFGVTRIGSPQDIWVMDADGGNPTQVMSGETDIFVLGWLSNEDVLAVPPRQRQLLGFNIRTGRQTKLRTIDFDIASPRLSPDGKRVVFNSRESGAVNLWVASLEGGAPKQLTFDHELMGFACWSPDGRYLAFEVKRGEDTHVAVIRSDGGSPTLLTSEPGQSWTYSWSPDGDKIAFAAMRGGAWNIAWVSMKTREQRQLTHDAKLNTYVRYPAWSPHGNQIVYEYAETIGNIWLMELR